MAINLNPGADATLVNAAYKAAVSTAPGDYSRTLERAADSYEKTMQAQSKTLGSIAALGTAIGGEMVANANELSAMAAEGAGLDAEGAKVLIEELYANKDAQKELRGINFLQSRETRQKRQALKLEQRELFANIKNATESIRLGSEAVAAGTFKVLTGNEAEADMVNAIIKSNLKDKVTNNKNIARLGRDEKTGELMYTMYNTESDPNGVSYDPPRTMTIRQFNKAITTNVDDKGVMKGKLDTINNAAAKAGNTSLNGTYHSEMKQMHLNQLDDIVKTDTDLQRAFGEKFGYSNSSFLEDIIKPSTLSLELYNTLLETTGSGDVLTGSITDNMIDTDGEAGISQAELQNNTNYGILSANILGMKDPKVSKALFKEYTIDKYEAAHKFGYSQKQPVAGGGTGTDGKETDNLGIPDYTYPKFGGGKIDSYDARTLKRRLLDGTSFNFNPTGNTNDSRAYDFIGGTWYENYDDEEKRVEIGTADQLVLDVFQTNHEAFQGLSTSIPEETINIEGETTDATTQKGLHADIFNKLDLNKDNAVSTSLNDYFGLSGKRKTLQFRPYTGLASEDALSRNMGADSMFTNDIMLYNPQTGKRVTDANGDTIRFKIGDDMGNLDEGTGLSKDVARILEVLKQNGVQPPTQLP